MYVIYVRVWEGGGVCVVLDLPCKLACVLGDIRLENHGVEVRGQAAARCRGVHSFTHSHHHRQMALAGGRGGCGECGGWAGGQGFGFDSGRGVDEGGNTTKLPHHLVVSQTQDLDQEWDRAGRTIKGRRFV